MMVGLSGLWLPILLSAVIVFIASSIIHMLPLWHKSDYPAVPNEDAVMNALRPLNIPPGEYMVPRAGGMAAMKTPEFQEKLKKGPVLSMQVYPNGPMTMGGRLVQWFIFSLVVGVFAAYVSGRALPLAAPYLKVFRFAGVTSFIAYTLGAWPFSIWFGRSWKNAAKTTVDGLIYGLLTAGVFGWLWPR